MINNRFADFRGRIAVTLAVLMLLMMVVINISPIPYAVPYIMTKAQEGAHLPDTMLHYGPDKLYSALDMLQPAGREAYKKFLLSFDTVFPLLYACALGLNTAVLLRPAFPKLARANKLYLIPLGAGIVDYLENGTLLLILDRYPKHLDAMAYLAGGFTLTKWLISASCLVALVISIVTIIVRRLNRRRTEAR